jgi:geranylgeranyl diphosphate synthase type II
MTRDAYRRNREVLRRLIDRHLRTLSATGADENLRDACRYVLSGRGKRIRSILVLLGCRAAGGSYRMALDAATAIEILHNFSLVHDDIMDNAGSRRGRPTVHRRWDTNTAILTGDVLIGMAYQVLLRSGRDHNGELSRVLTRGLLDICEGQGLDLALERKAHAGTTEYFHMIRKKTASLIATAAELGGLIGGATFRERSALREFGTRLGMAFQVHDDVLDVVGNPRQFGKTTGGDILEGKRTYLLVRAMTKAAGYDARVLRRLTRKHHLQARWKTGDGRVTPAGRRLISEVTSVYQRTAVLAEARLTVRRHTSRALRCLRTLPPTPARAMLAFLAEDLVDRKT